MKDSRDNVIIVKFESPITTGMSLALGFFLMSIVLSIIGWVILGLSCAAMIPR